MPNFQSSEVYRAALDFNAISAAISNDLILDQSPAASRLRKRSIALIAEIARAASADFNERARCYDRARASAAVCAALIDACFIDKSIDESRHQRSQALLGRIFTLLESRPIH